jgi:hypothetical protein
MSMLGVSEAATRLGVSTRQVQHLVAGGTLRQLARGVIDQASVERLIAVRSASHTRAWSEATAWGAVSLLSGATASWMGPSQRARLKARLRTMTAAEVVERARDRAEVTRYTGHASSAPRLRSELIETASAAAALGLADAGSVYGYLAASVESATVARHGLRRDEAGRFTLRATGVDLAVVADLAERSLVLAALDLAESLDVRESRVGRDVLDRALASLHD